MYINCSWKIHICWIVQYKKSWFLHWINDISAYFHALIRSFSIMSCIQLHSRHWPFQCLYAMNEIENCAVYYNRILKIYYGNHIEIVYFEKLTEKNYAFRYKAWIFLLIYKCFCKTLHVILWNIFFQSCFAQY